MEVIKTSHRQRQTAALAGEIHMTTFLTESDSRTTDGSSDRSLLTPPKIFIDLPAAGAKVFFELRVEPFGWRESQNPGSRPSCTPVSSDRRWWRGEHASCRSSTIHKAPSIGNFRILRSTKQPVRGQPTVLNVPRTLGRQRNSQRVCAPRKMPSLTERKLQKTICAVVVEMKV